MNLKDRIQYSLYNFAFKAQQMTGVNVRPPLQTKPKWTDWSGEKATQYGYKVAVYVYACIRKRATAAASVPWYVYKRDSAGDWQEIKNHPLEQLIESPNPFMSRSDLIERIVINLDLAGNSLFKKVNYNNIPVELWPVGPDNIKPVPDDNDFIKNYEMKVGNKKYTFETDEILHAMNIDPSNVFWGLGPLQVAAKTVDTDVEAVTWNKIALQNRAVTDGVFSFDQPLTGEQWTEARAQVRQQHQGSGNARAPWVLGSGARWNNMALSPAEMDFIQGRKMTREEICSVFDVPPPMVGLLDKANYATMREVRRVFWLDTIIPLLEGIKNVFNRGLTPYFGDGLYLDYDLSNVEALQENFNEKITSAKDLWTMGLPFNMINQRLELGFEDIQGGDIGYLPASILPAELAATGSAPADNEPQPNDPPNTETMPPESGKAAPSKKKEAQALKGLNLEHSEQKAAYWKAFERSRFQWYKLLQTQAADIFISEGKRVAAAYRDTGSSKKALAEIDLDIWETFLLTNYKAIAEQFGNETMNNFKSFADYEKKAGKFSFNPYDALINLYLRTMAGKKIKQIVNHTKELIGGLITSLREKGHGIAEIADEIGEQYVSMSEYRAYRIARTEVVGASNFGSYQAALQASDELGEMEKEWIDSADDRVRDSHGEENGVGGERQPLTGKFSNGLTYPGDLDGEAKEVIQCRCTLVYKVKR